MRYTIVMAALFLRPDRDFTSGDILLVIGMIVYALAGDVVEYLK